MKKSFTLIEVLTTVLVIGILSSIIIVSLDNSINNPLKDSQRKQAIANLQKIILSLKQSGSFPVESVECEIGNDCSTLQSVLVPEYISNLAGIPRDPNGGYYTYKSTDGNDFTIKANMSDNTKYQYNYLTGFSTAQPTAGLQGTITVKKIANDDITVLGQRTVTMEYLKDNFTVYGDDSTNYYYQKYVFVDNPDPEIEALLRWNPDEDTNVEEADMGTRQGTEIKDILSLVGGAVDGDEIKLFSNNSSIGNPTMTYNYSTIYNYISRRGRITLTWRKNGSYSFSESPQLIFMADTDVNPWGINAFGNWDMHETLPESNWKYFIWYGESYPLTREDCDYGVCGAGHDLQDIYQILIYSNLPPP